MTVVGSRERRRIETRQALLDAADQAFSSQGYADTSLDDVASRAGFTKGAVYGLFASKEDLFMAVLEARDAALVQDLTEALPAGASAEHLLHSLGTYLATYLQEQRGWALVNAEYAVLAARRPNLAARRKDELDRTVGRLTEMIAAAHPRLNEDLDLTTMARVVVAVMNGLALHAAIDDSIDLAHDFSAALKRLLYVDAPSTRGALA
jgi:AcrR family transcriptional regulator